MSSTRTSAAWRPSSAWRTRAGGVVLAGGRASTGRQPVLGVAPGALHQRIGLVFGSRNEVERIGRYHAEPVQVELDNPLFAKRSLFRD